MTELTRRQQAALNFIKSQLISDHAVPTTRQIQRHFGHKSQTSAVCLIRALEKKGHIEPLKTQRGYRLAHHTITLTENPTP